MADDQRDGCSTRIVYRDPPAAVMRVEHGVEVAWDEETDELLWVRVPGTGLLPFQHFAVEEIRHLDEHVEVRETQEVKDGRG